MVKKRRREDFQDERFWRGGGEESRIGNGADEDPSPIASNSNPTQPNTTATNPPVTACRFFDGSALT